MSENKRITRREFIQLAAMGAAGIVLTSCCPEEVVPGSTAAPTAVPPTAKPGEPTAEPAEPTVVAPTEAIDEGPKIGSELIGKLEGPARR